MAIKVVDKRMYNKYMYNYIQMASCFGGSGWAKTKRQGEGSEELEGEEAAAAARSD